MSCRSGREPAACICCVVIVMRHIDCRRSSTWRLASTDELAACDERSAAMTDKTAPRLICKTG